MICYVVAYLDRVNVGFAKLQMLRDLGLSDAAYGLGAGAFFVGYIVFGVPSNLLLHRFGARVWIACIMVTWGVLSAAMALVTTSRAIACAACFLLGNSGGRVLPGGDSLPDALVSQ